MDPRDPFDTQRMLETRTDPLYRGVMDDPMSWYKPSKIHPRMRPMTDYDRTLPELSYIPKSHRTSAVNMRAGLEDVQRAVAQDLAKLNGAAVAGGPQNVASARPEAAPPRTPPQPVRAVPDPKTAAYDAQNQSARRQSAVGRGEVQQVKPLAGELARWPAKKPL